MAFPNTYTTAVANVTPIEAIHINYLEAKVGITGDTPALNPLAISSLDYQINTKLNTAIFIVDHEIGGHHIEGGWHIGASTVTSTADELNRLDGVIPRVTAVNLNTLTAGPTSDASDLHTHGGVEFLTTPVNLISWVAAQTWTDVTILPYTGTDVAVAAILAVDLSAGSLTNGCEMTGLFRKNGSAAVSILPRIAVKTDQSLYAGWQFNARNANMLIVPCGSQIFEVKLQLDSGTPNTIAFKVDLIGYFV